MRSRRPVKVVQLHHRDRRDTLRYLNEPKVK